jgi:Leucine-rich repeat (LRR) protein
LLEELVLSHNSIKEIKIQKIFKTDALKILDFSDNKITIIKSNTFTKLPNLISLTLPD